MRPDITNVFAAFPARLVPLNDGRVSDADRAGGGLAAVRAAVSGRLPAMGWPKKEHAAPGGLTRLFFC